MSFQQFFPVKPLPNPADDHIRLLFDMQDEIDALLANPGDDTGGIGGLGSGGGGSWNITLADVCLRPLGTACATQSVLQYWGMSRDVFDHGACALHLKEAWSCR